MFNEIVARYPDLVNRKNLTRAGLVVAVALAGGTVYLAVGGGRGELEVDPQLGKEQEVPAGDVGGGDTGGIELPGGVVPGGVLPTPLPLGTGGGGWTFSGNAWYENGEVGQWTGFMCVDGVWVGEITYPDGRKEKVAVSPPAYPTPQR